MYFLGLVPMLIFGPGSDAFFYWPGEAVTFVHPSRFSHGRILVSDVTCGTCGAVNPVNSDACIFWGRPRRGAELSTLETFDSVLACFGKGCFNSRTTIPELYFEDRVGDQTGLPSYCKVVSTSGNEALHR